MGSNSGSRSSGEIRRIGWKRPCALRNRSSVSSSTAHRLPRSTAKTLSSSSGHSMARSAARSVPTSSRRWNDFDPTSRCAMPRASSARTYSCVRSAPKFVKRRNRMQTCSGWTGTHVVASSGRAPSSRSRCRATAMKAATALGEHSSIFTFDILRVPYGCGIGSATIAGLAGGRVDAAIERQVVGNRFLERGVDEGLDRLRRARAAGELRGRSRRPPCRSVQMRRNRRASARRKR